MVAEVGAVVTRQFTEAFRRNSLSSLRCTLRCSHLEKWCITRSWLSLPLSGCCLWSTGLWIRGRDALLRRLLEEFHTFSLAQWTRILRLLGLHARVEWRSVLSRCFSLQFRFCVARTWKFEHYFYEVNESGSACDDGWHFCCFFAAFSDSSPELSPCFQGDAN